jgi:hypothetical protein
MVTPLPLSAARCRDISRHELVIDHIGSSQMIATDGFVNADMGLKANMFRRASGYRIATHQLSGRLLKQFLLVSFVRAQFKRERAVLAAHRRLWRVFTKNETNSSQILCWRVLPEYVFTEIE